MLSKKEARLEKKKKKLSALSDVMKLNEQDRPKQPSTDEPSTKKSKLDLTEQNEQKDEILRELSIEQYKLLKKELTDKRNAIKNVPYMRLKDAGDRARMCIPVEQRSPLLLNDIQHLLMVALLHSRSPYTPWRWCHVEKASKLTHSVVLVIEGINAYNFSAFESKFERANTIFETLKFETLMPAADNKLLEELACVPLTESQKDQLIRKYGSLEAAMSSSQDHTFILRTVFSIREQQPKSTDEFELPANDKFPRTQLLLSPLQMLMNDYPLPFKGDLKNICEGYTTTKEMYDPVTPNSPMFGIDCEMCRTSTNYSELARISIVDEQHNLFYESMVLPDTEIIDYLTPYSGITKEMMLKATKTRQEVQEEIKNLLPADAILIGHSLNFDLHALKMIHPYCVDTSIIFNNTGEHTRKTKLKVFSELHLQETIQDSDMGHSSIEDSLASLKLTQLKLKNDIYFGDVVLQNKKNFNQRQYHSNIASNTESTSTASAEDGEKAKGDQVQTTIFNEIKKRSKTSSIVTTAKNNVDYEKYFKNANNVATENGNTDIPIGKIRHSQMKDAKTAVKTTCELAIEHDFNLVHLQFDELTEENNEKLIKRADKFIAKLWKCVALNGLFVVVLGGNTEQARGVTMVQIKNENNSMRCGDDELDQAEDGES